MKSKVPFAFAPVPRSVFAAWRGGRLTRAEWSVLCCLYDRANAVTWTVSSRDLDAVTRLVVWEDSLDYLSKTLRRLREKGWIDYESKPGRTRHGYVIRLLHGPTGASEEGPSSGGQTDPSTHATKPGVATPVVAAQTPDESELPERSSRPIIPSSGDAGPSSREPDTPEVERVSAGSATVPVRAARDVSREDHAWTNRNVLGQASRFTPGPDGRCENCDRLSECESCRHARVAAEVTLL